MDCLGSSEFPIQQLTERDIGGLICLSSLIGWDYDETDIQTILSIGRIYGYKTISGDIVSCAAIIAFENQLASIGMVIVHPEYRGLGLGKAVTIRCIQSLSNTVPIMLIATKEGESLYKSLNFKPVDYVYKLLSHSYHSPGSDVCDSTYCFSELTEERLSEVRKLDVLAFGADRRNFLVRRLKQARNAIMVQNEMGVTIGYALGIQGPVNLLVGPIVATEPTVALALVDYIVNGYTGRIRVDVPSGNPEFISMLKHCNFQIVNRPSVMLLNSKEIPRRNGFLYGIAAQIFG